MTIERKVGMGIAGQVGGQDLDTWYNTERYSQDTTAFTDSVVDSDGNVYVAGTFGTYANSATARVFWYVKYDYEGTVQFKKKINPNTGWGKVANGSCSIVLDEDNGYLYITGEADNKFYLFKVNSSNGSDVWKKELSSNGDAYCLAIDYSGNVIVHASTGNQTRVVKFAPNGTVTWARRATISNSENGAICVDPDDNIYISGRTNTSGNKLFVAKFNSSGAVQWQFAYVSSQTSAEVSYGASGMTFANSSLYVAFENSNQANLMRVNPATGAYTAAKKVTSCRDNPMSYNSLDHDEDGEIYWLTHNNTAQQPQVHKLNAGLSHHYSRRMFGVRSGSGIRGNGITVHRDTFIVTATASLFDYQFDSIVIVLPTDGSKAGNTFNKLIYLSVVTPASNAINATSTSFTFNSFTFGVSNTSAGWQDATSNVSNTFQSI
jgi:hypothetical protein